MQVMDRQKPLDESQGVLRRLLNETVAEAEELAALKSALRECRQRLHRGALESTRRIVALNSSVASLEALTQAQQSHIRNLEADLALVREQRRQTCWQEEHAVLHNEAHCVWTLKKNLADAQAGRGTRPPGPALLRTGCRIEQAIDRPIERRIEQAIDRPIDRPAAERPAARPMP